MGPNQRTKTDRLRQREMKERKETEEKFVTTESFFTTLKPLMQFNTNRRAERDENEKAELV